MNTRRNLTFVLVLLIVVLSIGTIAIVTAVLSKQGDSATSAGLSARTREETRSKRKNENADSPTSSALPPAEQEYTAQLVQVDDIDFPTIRLYWRIVDREGNVVRSFAPPTSAQLTESVGLQSNEVTIDRFQILDGNEPVNLAVMTDNDVLEISRNHNVMIIRMDLKHLIQSAQYVNGDHIGFYTENDVFPLTNDKAYALKRVERIFFLSSDKAKERDEYSILSSLSLLRGVKALFYYRGAAEPMETHALNLAIHAGIPIYGDGKQDYNIARPLSDLGKPYPSDIPEIDYTVNQQESELTGGMWFNETPQALKFVYDQLKSLYVTEYVTTIPDIDSVRHCSLDLRSEDGTIALVGSGQILFPSRLHLATPSDRVKPQRLAQNPNLAAAQQKQQEASSEGKAAEQTSLPTTPTAPNPQTTQPAPTTKPAPTTVTPPADAAYILPFSATRLVTEQDIAHLSVDQLELARNEIYARHGRQFRTEHIQEYFNRQPWYRGTIAPDRFDQNSLFNDIEKANVEFMLEYENKKRGR